MIPSERPGRFLVRPWSANGLDWSGHFLLERRDLSRSVGLWPEQAVRSMEQQAAAPPIMSRWVPCSPGKRQAMPYVRKDLDDGRARSRPGRDPAIAQRPRDARDDCQPAPDR